jgi:hypothetical protein
MKYVIGFQFQASTLLAIRIFRQYEPTTIVAWLMCGRLVARRKHNVQNLWLQTMTDGLRFLLSISRASKILQARFTAPRG